MATERSTDVEQLQAECRRLTEALLLADRERQHLAFDLHDGVVQDLTAAAMLLEGARRQARFETEEASENFAGGLRLLRDTIAEARRLIRGAAVVEAIDVDLGDALETVVEKLRDDLQLPVAFRCDCPIPTLPASMRHLLFRIVQEALYNAWKHARASEAEVRLSMNDGYLILTVADNGVGFDPAQVPPGHFGLQSIRARARALGAELVLDTAPNHGTRVVVRLKLAA
jgi:signal transduction histidine kinase